ncbi:long-chain fatty acid--CoA ligase [Magnetospira sp. QH-2]|uniref:AMP-dependent synthetase/ligase n=1 Tax=Magnetospira sp. (strain QH-2) TaxID=1288970 RepID=UPI0003E80CEF|nr:long-chain fatty acid--CoA ligase [Magnetospira sp. QH-2]CCQ74095.1 Putative long-chain-fatty-acid--CoA ligase [Magnetospira sp. QH-2]
MATYPWPNLAAMFFDQAQRLADKPFLWGKQDGVYVALTWGECAHHAESLARSLRAHGIGDGDRVMLAAENRPEWLIADIAIMAAGGITTPAYVTNTVDDHLHILTNSGAKGVIVSTRRLAERVLPAAHQAPDARFVVAMEEPVIDQSLSVDVLGWDRMIAEGTASDFDVAARVAALTSEDTACIIYTSGTGGLPKGVMTAHRAILHNCMGARDALLELGLDDEVFLSFLPLSHSYEHSAGLHFPVAIGAQIYYAEGVEHLGRNMVEAQPTIMTAVPRLYEMMHQKIMRGVEKNGGFKETLFHKTVALGLARQRGDSLGPIGWILDKILDKLVRSKVKASFGGRLKALVSGGGPLNPDIGRFFTALGLRILQGYGLTESGPVISVNRPRKVKMDTVGPVVLGTDFRLAEDGEICCRGDLVMQGYWRNDEATAESLKDGWLHTGDIGEIDEDCYIRITDRKKDIIVNSGGDNISPQRVEGLLTLEREIAQAMVYGDKHPHLVALIVPDEDWLKTWAGANGKPADLKQLTADEDLHDALRPAFDRVNAQLSNIEKVRRFCLAREPFGIDNSQMTPTMKIRRHVIREVYGARLEGLYG